MARPSLPPFLRYLFGNLAISVIVVVVGLGAVVGYALLSDTKAKWGIVIALAVGMTISSVINTVIEVKEKKGEG